MLESLPNALLACNSIFLGLAVVAVFARFLLRRKYLHRFGSDDWFVLAALFFTIGLCLTLIIGVARGRIGSLYIGDEDSRTHLKFCFAWSFFYLFAVASVKLSVLSFYGRIFHSSALQLANFIVTYVVCAWLVAFFWATLFRVYPLRCNWDIDMQEGCGMSHVTQVYVSSSAAELALNLVIILMPMPMVRKLSLTKRQWMALVSVFSFGLFCVAASVLRLAFSIRYFQNYPSGREFVLGESLEMPAVNMTLWSCIEASASVICACLPIFGQSFANIPALQNYSFAQISPKSEHAYPANSRFTGGVRDIDRSRRLRLSGLSQIDTKVTGMQTPRTRRMTDSSDAEQMIITLPSPLMTPKVRGNPTNRDCREPEIEMGKIHLRTGSDDDSIAKTRKEVV